MTFSTVQFSLSTHEEERNYFTGEVASTRPLEAGVDPSVSEGFYRVIDGELYRVSQDVPPALT